MCYSQTDCVVNCCLNQRRRNLQTLPVLVLIAIIGLWHPLAHAAREKKTDPSATLQHLHKAVQPENASQVPSAYPADTADPRRRERLVLVSYRDLLDQAEKELKKAGKVKAKQIQEEFANGVALRKKLVKGQLSNHNIRLKRDFPALPMMLVEMDDPGISKVIAAIPGVLGVYLNRKYPLNLQQSLPLIRQPEAAVEGFLGTGTSVAVLDTGVDYKRPAFGNCPYPGATGCKVAFAADFTEHDDGELDAHGHGTNVSGIVLGVAPDTRILGLDVFSGSYAYASDIVAAIDWSIAHQAEYNIVAMNLSLGSYPNISECTNSWATAPFAAARAAGIAPVVAAGNDGRKNGISDPACAPGAIRVGAVYDADLGHMGWLNCKDSTTHADKVTCFSNSSNLLTLLAPGASIDAAGLTMSGTSMAAPHVAGAYAVLRGVNASPDLSIDEATATLQTSGVPVTDTANNLQHPRINLAAAMELIDTSGLALIQSFYPTTAGTGEQILIRGSRLTGVTSVRFGGVEAQSFRLIDNTLIAATLAQGSSGDLVLTNSVGSAAASGFVHRGSSLTSLSASPSQIQFTSLGESIQLQVLGNYSNGVTADLSQTTSCTSSNPNVASIDPSGKITALVNGTATITLVNGVVSASVNVTVNSPSIGSREIEPNNSALTANPVSINSHQFSGNLPERADKDYFTFTLDLIGELTILVKPVNSNYDGGVINASIQDSSGAVLSGRRIKSDEPDYIRLSSIITRPGAYYLVIEAVPGYLIFTKDYQVQIDYNPNITLVSHREVEPNNHLSGADPKALTDGTFLGQIYPAAENYSADVDTYSFETSTAGEVHFYLNPEDSIYDGGVLQISILDQYGSPLASRKMKSDEPYSTLLAARFDQPTTGYLRVERVAGYRLFDKEYLVQPLMLAVSDYTHDREREPNNSLAQANSIFLMGQMLEGQLMSTTDVDYFKFRMGSAREITFSIQPENSAYDGGIIVVAVQDAMGNLLNATEVKSDHSSPQTLSIYIPQAGEYSLSVKAKSGYRIFDKHYIITLPLTASYLQALIEPQEAIDAGAKWRRTGTTEWLDSEDTEHDLAPGGYNVAFKPIPGWNTPPNESVTVEIGHTAEATGLYEENTSTYAIEVGTATQGGSVAGGDTYLHNTWVTLTATPDQGWAFSHWTLNGQRVQGLGATYEFYATSDCDIAAHFRQIKGLPGVMMLLLEDE